MRPKRALFVLFFVFGVAIPALATNDQSAEELERNRRLLQAWRADPEHYARLRHDLKAFWEMTPEQRERLRRLDHDLHETDARTQKRLFAILERYASWLERLPESDRQQIAAVDRSDRVKAIQAVRDRQYIDSLPTKLRDELTQLPATERRTQIDRLRKQDRQLRLACVQLASQRLEPPPPPKPNPTPQPYRPTHLADFPPDVRSYVELMLWKQIKPEEKQQIKIAEGAPWPLLARTILDLASSHPVKLPGQANGPRRLFDLQDDIRTVAMKEMTAAQKKHLTEFAGRWPEFAIEFTYIARKNGTSLPRQLGPCHPRQFDLPIAEFIDKKLIPALTNKEKDELKAAEGRWPEYQKTLLELSKKHGLEIPLMRLPGPRELWDSARAS
jgi:hypothetical protein